MTLFPSIDPYDSGYMTRNHHHIYWTVSGNPKGVPVVFLHGGPGAGTSPKSRQYFDPDFYKIIVFDQRGAGQSKPHGNMKDNTTFHLIDDMEHLRKNLDIEAWVVFGGSWGSTLGLCYAIQHPERCLHLILRGIFLGLPREINWFFQGVQTFYPDVWEDFAAFIPLSERHDLLGAYKKRVLSDDPAIYGPAVKMFSGYEGRLATVMPSETIVTSFEDHKVAFGLARAECHYFSQALFLEPNYILNHSQTIQSISGTIIQGRCDVICPPLSAWMLHKAWPQSRLIMVEGNGHSASEPGIEAELLKATQAYKESHT